jgi:hypothetical protein
MNWCLIKNNNNFLILITLTIIQQLAKYNNTRKTNKNNIYNINIKSEIKSSRSSIIRYIALFSLIETKNKENRFVACL